MKIRIIPRLDIKGPNLIKTVFYEGLRIMGDPKKYIKQYKRKNISYALKGYRELVHKNLLKNSIFPSGYVYEIPLHKQPVFKAL